MGNRGRAGGAGILIAIIIAIVSLFRYFGSTQTNTVTGEKQHVGGVTTQQEIALGLQATPQMLQQFGGEESGTRASGIVDEIGQRLLSQSDAGKTQYQFDFHLLNDSQTINAFALPGGQVFVTEALASKLHSKAELAGVIGHEIGHVIARHGAEHIAKQQLTQGLTGAAVLATYDPNNPNSTRNAAVLQAIAQLVDMKYGRDDELEADRLGVKFMSEAGYDPRAMIEVMKVLKSAGGGGRTPEFFSTHPNPDNRIERIEEEIKKEFPNGVPNNLEK